MYDIKTGNEITIANRNIEQVEKVSKELYVRINFPYEIKMKKADKIANLVADLLNKEEFIYTAKNVGLVDLASSSKDYCIAITCHPEDKLKANTFDLSIPVGLSYEYKNFVLDGRYNFGVTNVAKGVNTKKSHKSYLWTI